MLMQIAANILGRKNNSASLPIKEQRLYFGRSQPELTYFSVPAIVYEAHTAFDLHLDQLQLEYRTPS